MTAFVVRNRTEAKEKALFPFIFLSSVDRHRGDYLSAHRYSIVAKNKKYCVRFYPEVYFMMNNNTAILHLSALRFIHSSNHLLICSFNKYLSNTWDIVAFNIVIQMKDDSSWQNRVPKQHDQNYAHEIPHVVIISDKLLREYIFIYLLNFLN